MLFRLDEDDLRIALVPGVLAHFANHAQRRWHQREAGGQLFAYFHASTVVVSRATGPRRSDRRFRFSYRPDRDIEQREIDAMFSEGLHYVGDWHTHPQPIPVPSGQDRRTIADIESRSRHSLTGLLMIIVGTMAPPQGLYVAKSSQGALRQAAFDRVEDPPYQPPEPVVRL